MKIYDGEKWVNVAGDAGFVDDILSVGGENNRQIIVKDSNNEILGVLSKDGIEINNAKFNNVQALNLITKTDKALELTVNNGESIQYVLNSLPKYLTYDVVINVMQGTYNEDIVIGGFFGEGQLTINLRTVVINGSIEVKQNKNVTIYGFNVSEINHTSENTENVITVSATNWANIDAVKINGRGSATQRGVYFTDGSNGRVAEAIINGVQKVDGGAVMSNYCSNVYVVNVKGTNLLNALHAARGGKIAIAGYIPSSTGTQKLESAGGQITGTATTQSYTETPKVPIANKTLKFDANSYKFWRTSIAKWQNGIYIGDYGKSIGGTATGNNLGVFGIDLTSLRSQLTGKKITGVKVAIRRSTSGGYDSIVEPHLGITTSTGSGSAPTVFKNYGSLGGFSKGQYREVSLPTTFITDIINTTSIKSLILHRPDEKNYSIFENALQLYVTYEDVSTLQATLEEPIDN